MLDATILVKYMDEFKLKQAKRGDAGLELFVVQDIHLCSKAYARVANGLHIKIPGGFTGFIRSRSSLFKRTGLLVIPGLIDSGYTGMVYTQIYNPGSAEVNVLRGDRLSQLIIIPVPDIEVVDVDELPWTERGENGFGSTG